MKSTIENIVKQNNGDKCRLMNMLHSIQEEFGYISDEAILALSSNLGISTVSIEETISFYHFYLRKDAGKYRIYLNDSVMSILHGYEEVKQAFEKNIGVKMGECSIDGIGLYHTACIGMSDQEPAAIINNRIFPNLTVEKVAEIVSNMKANKAVDELIAEPLGDGKNSHPLLKSYVNNNIRKSGILLDDYYVNGTSLATSVKKSEWEVIGIVKTSGLRGRGGAGFPTGMKWEFCRLSPGQPKYVFCNADEGEPGTFKDRVLLTEKPMMVFEGMAIAGYAIGAKEGILYLRYEYKYMEAYLESVLEEMRSKKMLGNNILNKAGFDFDIRIQFGAGAYICGEESSLIESSEGKRGEPRFKPPFPVEVGYKGKPTSVNNVETYAAICRIIENGGEWYRSIGTKASSGTKLLSISGDCIRPGIYEIEWGMSIKEMLEMVGATNTQAVQVGGPSGSLINSSEFDRTICYGDLPTGGSMMIFDNSRNLIKDVVRNFMDFFIDESCGSCTTCRITSVQLAKKLDKILDGYGVMQDIEDLEKWSKIMLASRCGLGQTASNPVVFSVKNFKPLYESLIQKDKEFDTGFDLEKSVREYCEVSQREVEFSH